MVVKSSCFTGSPNSAKEKADLVCQNSSSCKGTSTCAGICTHVGNTYTYSGFCVY